MITNRIGYTPAVRQSAPQRQNLAFGAEIFGTETNGLPARKFPKKFTIFTALISLLSLQSVNVSHAINRRIPNAHAAIAKEVKDTAKAGKILRNAKAIDAVERMSALYSLKGSEEKYLAGVLDSLHGGKSTPGEDFSPQIAKGERFKAAVAKAQQLDNLSDVKFYEANRIREKADSIYKSVGAARVNGN